MLSTSDVISIAWKVIQESRLNSKNVDIHQLSKDCVEAIILEAMKKKSNDNLTAIFIGLPGLVDYLNDNNIFSQNSNLPSKKNKSIIINSNPGKKSNNER